MQSLTSEMLLDNYFTNGCEATDQLKRPDSLSSMYLFRVITTEWHSPWSQTSQSLKKNSN